MRKYDVAAAGELLIDFTPVGKGSMGNTIFERNPGGAPANLLAACAKLGDKTAFIGKVGADSFGDFLSKTLENAGIDTKGLCRNESVHTTLAFVDLDQNGNRSFSFYRNPGADMTLEFSDIPEELIHSSHVFHFGSVSLTNEPASKAVLRSVIEAKASGALISYDPNYRPPLWDSEERAVEMMRTVAKYADIIKVSDEESLLLSGEETQEKAINYFLELGASLVLVTLGPRGAIFGTPLVRGERRTFDVKTIDTTGSGDAFLGAMLHCLKGMSASDITALPRETLESFVDYANAAGSLASTKNGAIPSLPTDEEIKDCVANGKRLD